MIVSCISLDSCYFTTRKVTAPHCSSTDNFIPGPYKTSCIQRVILSFRVPRSKLSLTNVRAYYVFFPKASAKGSSSNCVAHTTQHNTTQHHTTARHTPPRPTTAPHTTARHTPTIAPRTTARHTPQQDATPPDRLIVFLLYS